MSVASLFNQIEQAFAPQRVIDQQRDELLGLDGQYAARRRPRRKRPRRLLRPPLTQR